MTSEMERLDKHRGQVLTRSGPASYVDTGGPGRPVLFVHGVGTSSYLWRNVIGLLDGERRCVAIDLPLHGHTPAAADQDFTLPGLARFVADCCDALELTDIDMVANDTGAARRHPGVRRFYHAERLHTLTLTNCEAHDNVPPKLGGPPSCSLTWAWPRVLPPGWYATSRGPRNASTAAATRTSPSCPTTSRASGWNRCPRNRPARTSA